MAAKPGFFNDNLFRAYPFLEEQEDVAVFANRLIADFGCTFLPGAAYNAAENRVWLSWVRRVNCGIGTTTTTTSSGEDIIGDIEFGFRTDVVGMENALLVFRVAADELQFATVDGWYFEVADEDLPTSFDEPEIDCESLPKWDGFLTIGDLEDLLLALDCGEFATGEYYVEPARIEDRTGHYLRSLRLANAERTRATSPTGCRPLCWPIDFQDYYFVCDCLSGAVAFADGHSLTASIDEGRNAIVFAASPGSGLGYPCVEQPYFADEEGPADRSTLSGALLCQETIRQINGIAAAQFLFQQGPGVTITSKQAQHRIIVDVNMLGFAAKPELPAAEAVPCEPPDEDPCHCGPLDEEDFECPDPPETGGCAGSLGIYSKRTGGPRDTVLSFVAKDGDNYLTDAPIRGIRYYYDDRTDETPPYPHEDVEVSLPLGWSAAELEAALESLTSIGTGNVEVTKGTSVYQGRSIGWFTIRFTGDFAGLLVPFGVAWQDGHMEPGGDCEGYLSAADAFAWEVDAGDVGAWEADSRYISDDPCERAFPDDSPSDHLRGYLQVGGLVNARHRIRVYGSPNDAGTFVLSFGGDETIPILCNEAVDDLELILEDVLGLGNVMVTGEPGDYLLEYVGDLAGQPIELPEGEITPCPDPVDSTTTTPESSADGLYGAVESGDVAQKVWKYVGGATPCFTDDTCGYDIPTTSPIANDSGSGATYERNPANLIVGGEAADGDLSRWLDDTTLNSLVRDYGSMHRALLTTRSGGSEPIFLVDNTHSLYQQFWVKDNGDYELTIECYSTAGVGEVDIDLGYLGRWYDAATSPLVTTAVRYNFGGPGYSSGASVPLTITATLSSLVASWSLTGWGAPPDAVNILLSIRTFGLRELEIHSIRFEPVS